MEIILTRLATIALLVIITTTTVTVLKQRQSINLMFHQINKLWEVKTEFEECTGNSIFPSEKEFWMKRITEELMKQNENQCKHPKQPNVFKTETITIEGCEYIKYTHKDTSGLIHKENCKYCNSRYENTEIRPLKKNKS